MGSVQEQIENEVLQPKFRERIFRQDQKDIEHSECNFLFHVHERKLRTEEAIGDKDQLQCAGEK
jgi:hypothetical protein